MSEDVIAARIEAKRKKLEEAAARRRTSSGDATGSADTTGSGDTTGDGGEPAPAAAAASPPAASPALEVKPPKTDVSLSAPVKAASAPATTAPATTAPATTAPATTAPATSATAASAPAATATAAAAKPPKTEVSLGAPAAKPAASGRAPTSPAPPSGRQAPAPGSPAAKPAAPAAGGPRPPSARTAPTPAAPTPTPPGVPEGAPLPPWLLGVAGLVVLVILILIIYLNSRPTDAKTDGGLEGRTDASLPGDPKTSPPSDPTPPVATPTSPTPTSPTPTNPTPTNPTPTNPTPPVTNPTPPDPPAPPPVNPPVEPTPTNPTPPSPPVTPPTPPPTKIDAVHVAPVVSATGGVGRIELSWTPAAENHHIVMRAYEVLRSPLGEGDWTKVGDTPGDKTSIVDTTAPVGTASVYKVVSYAFPTPDATLPRGADRAESGESNPVIAIREFFLQPARVVVPTLEDLDRNPELKATAYLTVMRWDPETNAYQRHGANVTVGQPIGGPQKIRGGRTFDFTMKATLEEVRVETRKDPKHGHDVQVAVVRVKYLDGRTEEFDDRMDAPR